MEVVRIFIQIEFTCLFPLRKEVGIVFVRVVRLGFIYCLWTLGLILCDFEYKFQFACQTDMDKCMYKRLELSLEYSSYSSWQTWFYKLTNIPWRTESGHQVWSVWVWSPWEAICWYEHKCWPRNCRRATAGDGWASLPPASPHPWGSLYFTRPMFLELVSSLTQTHPGILNAIFWCSCLNFQDVSSEASCSRKKWDVLYLMPHAFSEGMFGLPVYQHADKMEVFWETLADPVPKSSSCLWTISGGYLTCSIPCGVCLWLPDFFLLSPIPHPPLLSPYCKCLVYILWVPGQSAGKAVMTGSSALCGCCSLVGGKASY